MDHKLDNDIKIWKGNGNTTTLLFSLKRLEIVHQEGRGQVKSIVMEHFNVILFHKSGSANKQHTNQPTNQPLQISSYLNSSRYWIRTLAVNSSPTCIEPASHPIVLLFFFVDFPLCHLSWYQFLLILWNITVGPPLTCDQLSAEATFKDNTQGTLDYRNI
jgi:hypothetical protein